MTTASSTTDQPDVPPCDRGIPGNTRSRGEHHFELQFDRVTIACTRCGQRAAGSPPAPIPAPWPLGPSYPLPVYPGPTYPYQIMCGGGPGPLTT